MMAADRRKLNKDAGFSLLELLIAVIILAIIVIPLLNLFLSSNRLNIKSRQTLRATTAAQDIMEGLKAYDIREIREQFADPASGFYVIDSRLIKGDVEEVEALEKDPSGDLIPGLYVFSMKELSLQGSRFDAKIEVDGREYRADTSTAPPNTHDNKFNDSSLSYARSIDKKHGTFVESDKLRKAVLSGVCKHPDVVTAVKAKLKESGVADDELEGEFLKWKTLLCYKNLSGMFDEVSRKIEVELTKDVTDPDENGEPRVFMKVTQTYTFTCTYTDAAGTSKTESVSIKGDIDAGYLANDLDCGKITALQDGSPHGSLNVNLLYYPLYGPVGKVKDDEIIIKSNSDANLSLLIAKQRCDIGDPDYLTDPLLKQEEERYHAKVEVVGRLADQFTLKTNLGMNLVEAVKGTPVYVNNQFYLNTTPMVAAVPPADGSAYHIFTLDGVRSPMGKALGPDETAELIYDVKVSIYKEGAADRDFPDDDRMVEITGSMTN